MSIYIRKFCGALKFFFILLSQLIFVDKQHIIHYTISLILEAISLPHLVFFDKKPGIILKAQFLLLRKLEIKGFKILDMRGIIILSNYYEWEESKVLLKNLKKYNTILVVDIGAHIGKYALLFRPLLKLNKKIIYLGIEANPITFKALEQNIKNIKYLQVILLNRLFSNLRVPAEFNIYLPLDWSSTLHFSNLYLLKKLRIKTITPEELINIIKYLYNKYKFDIVFVKYDIENYDEKLLISFLYKIRNLRIPCICFAEVSPQMIKKLEKSFRVISQHEIYVYKSGELQRATKVIFKSEWETYH